MSFSIRNLFSQDDSKKTEPGLGGSAFEADRNQPPPLPGNPPAESTPYTIQELLAFIPPAISAQGALPMDQAVQIPVSGQGGDVKLSDIYRACPGLFAAEITPLNDSLVTLPPKMPPVSAAVEAGAMDMSAGPDPGGNPFADAVNSPLNPGGMDKADMPEALDQPNPFSAEAETAPESNFEPNPAPQPTAGSFPPLPESSPSASPESPNPFGAQTDPATPRQGFAESATPINPIAQGMQEATPPPAAEDNPFSMPEAPAPEPAAANPFAEPSADLSKPSAEPEAAPMVGFENLPEPEEPSGFLASDDGKNPFLNNAGDAAPSEAGNPFEQGPGFSTLFSEQAEKDASLENPSADSAFSAPADTGFAVPASAEPGFSTPAEAPATVGFEAPTANDPVAGNPFGAQAADSPPAEQPAAATGFGEAIENTPAQSAPEESSSPAPAATDIGAIPLADEPAGAFGPGFSPPKEEGFSNQEPAAFSAPVAAQSESPKQEEAQVDFGAFPPLNETAVEAEETAPAEEEKPRLAKNVELSVKMPSTPEPAENANAGPTVENITVERANDGGFAAAAAAATAASAGAVATSAFANPAATEEPPVAPAPQEEGGFIVPASVEEPPAAVTEPVEEKPEPAAAVEEPKTAVAEETATPAFDFTPDTTVEADSLSPEAAPKEEVVGTPEPIEAEPIAASVPEVAVEEEIDLSAFPAAMDDEIVKDVELRAVFGTNEEFTLRKIATLIVCMPGVSACAVVNPFKALQASRDEDTQIGDDARAMAENVKQLAALTGIPEAKSFTIHTDKGIMSLFSEGGSTLTVLHEPGGFEDGVREKLMLVTRALDSIED